MSKTFQKVKDSQQKSVMITANSEANDIEKE